ncbi:hypothetical protein GCM10009530_17960 [Microbispora corallina]|uniref:Transposase n=1 Tax=Microbispora corallina TaxID=83302 RepID=A0ABQ4FY62_9ACTN|nr:hypothetical protein MPTA5024_21935 [Microbispora sp. ATCC PTA-5024]GIH39755.1 hypothetical protein Mco01_27550 [Microbispora corallina]
MGATIRAVNRVGTRQFRGERRLFRLRLSVFDCSMLTGPAIFRLAFTRLDSMK